MDDWLSEIEKDYEVEILFACEAGSRAWGISNPSSDFDIRYIYRYHSMKKYLSLNKQKSTLDFQSPFDVSGFDIFKAFELIAKSNPSIYEWAYSPVIYKDESGFSSQLKKVVKINYSPYSLFKHYGSLSKRNLTEVSKGSYSLKKQKQLLQALRAELIRIGIVQTRLTDSPHNLIEIAKTFHPNLFAAYLSISEAKRNNELLALEDLVMMIHLLQLSLKHTDQQLDVPKLQPSYEMLDQWIWKIFGL